MKEPFLCPRCTKLHGPHAANGGTPLAVEFTRISSGEGAWELAQLLASKDYRQVQCSLHCVRVCVCACVQCCDGLQKARCMSVNQRPPDTCTSCCWAWYTVPVGVTVKLPPTLPHIAALARRPVALTKSVCACPAASGMWSNGARCCVC
jgi:hypothetical protein